MPEAGVTGGEQLGELGRRFKVVGDEFGKDLLAGISTAEKKTVPEIRASARRILPRAGGLADRVAGQRFAVRASMRAGRATVTITGSGMKELATIDRGHLYKPVFSRDVWAEQSVTPGFFSRSVIGSERLVHSEVDHVMSDTAKKLEKPL